MNPSFRTHSVNIILSLLIPAALFAGCATLFPDRDTGGESVASDPGSPEAIAAALSTDPETLSRQQEEAEEARKAAEEQQRHLVRNALQRQDVVLGMSAPDVERAWGEPAEVEYAGHPSRGNFRWIYYQGLSKAWSLSGRRIVYFEAGHVAGWETQKR